MLNTILNMLPFLTRNNAGNNIKRKNALNALIIGIHGKSDTLIHEKIRGLPVFLIQHIYRKLAQHIKNLSIPLTHTFKGEHLIPARK